MPPNYWIFDPILVPKVWGSRRIPDLLGISSTEPIGELWSFSSLPERPTRIATGPQAGLTFLEATGSDFPILVKLLDTSQPLSLQVHPNDELAMQLENQPRGKTEAWLILEAGNARMVHGIKTTTDELFKADENILDHLNIIELNTGDVVPIPAGTVHASIDPMFVAEVQQASDLTYRIYDWGRTDRELHIDKAKFALSETSILVPCQPTELHGIKKLFSCEHFTMEEIKIDREAVFTASHDYELYMVLSGAFMVADFSATIGQSIIVQKGNNLPFEGSGSLLRVFI